ncbi:MAG: peptide deformylase [Firmicutes bacterium]|nr:peptide deformylase [Bacillota bacterium]
MQRSIWTIPSQRKFLRQPCQPVETFGEPLKQLAQDFLDTWKTVAAYGIAAPQIGVNLRAFIWKGIDMDEPEVIVNPRLLQAHGSVKDYDGCLSVPGIYGPTRRAETIEISGYDLAGQFFKRTMSGFNARIIQHEMDHLEGILFIDRIDRVNELYVLQKTGQIVDGEEEYEQQALPLSSKAIVMSARKPVPAQFKYGK